MIFARFRQKNCNDVERLKESRLVSSLVFIPISQILRVMKYHQGLKVVKLGQ